MRTRSLVERKLAFSLVELTVALAVASFCIFVIFALLPIGIATNQNSIDQTVAANLTSSIVADLRGVPNNGKASSSPRYGVSIPAPGSASQSTSILLTPDSSTNSLTNPSAPATFRATITVNPPSTGRSASTARILITWPALADQNLSLPPSHYSGSFVSVVGIDRN
jgi:uncharacterized protein (TIGR02598 family)